MGFYNNIFAKLLNKSGKEKIFIVILTGILLIVVAMPVNSGKSNKAANTTSMGEEVDEEISNYEKVYEKRIGEILASVEGVGETKVIVNITKDSDDTAAVSGVVVVAKGGDDGTVVSNITTALEALLGIPVHKIKVLKML